MSQGVQEWTKQNLWKTTFKKFEVIADHITSVFLKAVHITSVFLKAVLHKFYLVLS